MSPEQCKGQKDLDKRLDIYSLGILLFELLTCHRPFDGNGFDLMSKHVHEPLPSISAQRPDVPQWLENIARKCTEKQRERRYGSCEELLAQIPADFQNRPSSTVPAAPIMAPKSPSTVPAMPVMMDPPRMTMPSTHTAPASAVTTSHSTSSAPPNRVPMVAATILLSVALGLGASYSLGWFGQKSTLPEEAAHSTPSANTHTPDPLPAKPTTPKGKSPLDALQGSWKSSSGREYNAVLVGDVLEMRIHDVKPFMIQGYEQDEPRLLLRVAPGKTDTFMVEDRLRPNAPAGTEYDRARARLTCLVPFSEINGKPLEARLENGQLRISMVVITPDPSRYTLDGKLVTGCRDLLTSTVSPIESVLSRP
jgi:serine/threonine-protein kinase